MTSVSEQDRLAMRTVNNGSRADMTEHWLDDTTVLLQENWGRTSISHYTADHWFLIVDGTPVAFLHTMTYLNYPTYRFVLCDIEVRDTHRGNGYARRIIEAVNTVEGDTLHTSGGFTPLGAQALNWVPLLPGTTPGVQFDDQSFVATWDTLTSVHPL